MVADSVGHTLSGADIILTSTVPIGAGLSSSAAIEMAMGFAILSLNGGDVDRTSLALAGQQVEHKFVGTKSGIMDQFTSVFARAGNAMLLDCRSLEIEYVPIGFDDASIVVIDSKVKHDLATSEYNVRRAECEEGVVILKERLPQIKSLRDVTLDDFDRYRDVLPDVVARRCRHVISENDRTLSAAAAFRNNDLETAGMLMSQSHASLRDDYEVSCAELDLLVDIALSAGGVFGARMTGGGFGGCTVNLVANDSLDKVRSAVGEQYSFEFGYAPDFYIFQPTDGASEIAV
jgi:galactokinase